MNFLKLLGATTGRIALAVFGTALALAFTAGVGEGLADAQDAFEALIGVGFGVIVVSVAAAVISYVTLPALRHLGVVWTQALDTRPSRGAAGYFASLGVAEAVSAALLMSLGAARYRQGMAEHQGHWAQQGALILVGGFVLGAGSAVARFVAAARAQPTRRKRDPDELAIERELARREARQRGATDSLHKMTLCLGLGLALAMTLNGAP